MDKVYEGFLNPENCYKPIPFWSWNDELEEYEIRRQIREMKKAGFGGYFMHARIGLLTPYLEDKWMEIIKAAVDEGNKQGMDSWLYDENKWPSGFAGGAVPRANPDFRYKYLVCLTNQQKDEILKQNLQVQLNRMREESFLLTQFTKANLIAESKFENVEYSFYEWVAPMGDEWYFGTSYVDLLNPECVKYFIESTYEKYSKECGHLFNAGIPGIFTDEPTIEYWKRYPFKYLAWTKDFSKIFMDEKKYDITEHLLELFIDANDYKKIRYDYYEVLTKRFVETYSKQIYDWCVKRKIKFTGHYLHEDSLQRQVVTSGAVMPHYEYETYPGIDMLGNHVGPMGNYLTIKQMTSVADQLDKKRALSETYGGGGWNMTLSQQKLMAEIQISLGVNLLNPHLSLYSMKGSRKRDYPPSLFYQQPYWENYNILNDYLSRLCSILSQGKRELDILIIHPIGSAWMDFSPYDTTKVEKRNSDLITIVDKLLHNQKDFHLGDEYIIEKYGSVKDSELLIGEMKYKYVILPSLSTIRKKTYALLKEFAKNGGKIFCLNEIPSLLDGNEKFDFDIISDKMKISEFVANLEEFLPQKITVTGPNKANILIHSRKIGKNYIYYILNGNIHQKAEAALEINSKLTFIEVWNPLDGSKSSLNSTYQNNKHKISLNLFQGESVLLYNIDKKNGSMKTIHADDTEIKEKSVLHGDWKLDSCSHNCLTLDYCQYKIDGIGYSKILPVNGIQNELKNLGGKKLTLKYEFEIESIPSMIKEIFLILEYSKGMVIKINDNVLNYENSQWWLDISFKKESIQQYIHGGMNIIEIETEINKDTELENIYLLGDFVLRNYNNRLFSLLTKDMHIQLGDFTRQGYPFFAGKMGVAKNFDVPKTGFSKCILNIEKVDAILLNVFINKEFAGTMGWKPYKLDITKFVKKGSNEIKLELVSSCRNLLGPHHLNIEDPPFIGPEQFCDNEKWDNKYSFIPFGIETAPEILIY